MSDKTPTEMYNELIELGYVVPAQEEPHGVADLTAYISPPTTLAFATPPIPLWNPEGGVADAKLGRGSKRNTKRKKRAARR